LCIRKRQP